MNDFSEDDVIEEFEATKTYILRMQECSPEIGRYIKSLGHMYSLWSFVSINYESLPPVETVAEKYFQFMENIDKLVEEKFTTTFSPDISDPLYRYYWGAQGATTDNNQRIDRYEALVKFLLS